MEQTLIVHQQDVKQVWNVSLNGKKLGELVRDENAMVVTFAIPSAALVEGENSLKIDCPSASKNPSDDIRVGRIALVDRSVAAVGCDHGGGCGWRSRPWAAVGAVAGVLVNEPSIEHDLPVGVELGEVGAFAPADERVAIWQLLHVAFVVYPLGRFVLELANEFGGAVGEIEP